MEALDFNRKAEQRSILTNSGQTSPTAIYALKAVSPSQEQRILQLPAYALYRKPLQNNAGLAYFTPGIDTPGDPSHPIRP